MNAQKRDIVLWLAYAGVAAGITVLVASLRLSDSSVDTGLAGALCDGFFVAAVVYLSFALIGYIAGLGAFDGMSYMLHRLKRMFSRAQTKGAQESYFDFVRNQKNSEKRSDLAGKAALIGGVCLAAAIICLMVFNRA